MNLLEAIEIRRSKRKYLGTPIESQKVSKLQKFIAKYNEIGNVRMELITNNGKAFNGLRKSYGLLSGVNDYIGLIANKNDPNSVERLGYYGEIITLQATILGLGSCWVGGSFSRADTPFTLSDDEELKCTIVIGNVGNNVSFKEKLITNLIHRKTKNIEEMYTSNSLVPDWFVEGMKAVQKAPSAMNGQPVMFSYKDGRVYANVNDIAKHFIPFDFGIAKLHFEIGAGGGSWDWGNNGEFTHKSAIMGE